MKPERKTEIDGVIFILLGLFVALQWFLSRFIVILETKHYDGQKYTIELNSSPTLSAIFEANNISTLIQSIGYLIPMLFLLLWGILTITQTDDRIRIKRIGTYLSFVPIIGFSLLYLSFSLENFLLLIISIGSITISPIAGLILGIMGRPLKEGKRLFDLIGITLNSIWILINGTLLILNS